MNSWIPDIILFFAYIYSLPYIFGCTWLFHNLRSVQDKNKLSVKAIKCILLGYSILQKVYHCYFPGTNQYFRFSNIFHSSHPLLNLFPCLKYYLLYSFLLTTVLSWSAYMSQWSSCISASCTTTLTNLVQLSGDNSPPVVQRGNCSFSNPWIFSLFELPLSYHTTFVSSLSSLSFSKNTSETLSRSVLLQALRTGT